MTITVSSGVTSSGLTLSAGDTANILSGGTAEMFVVSSGGSEIVFSGGLSLDDTIDSGGLETVSNGGSATGLGLASGATLTDNGVVTYSGATAVTLAGTVAGSGTLVQDGAGKLVISAASAVAPISVDVTVSGAQGPWSPSENPSLNYGSNPNGGEASVSGSLSFTAGQQITVTYLSGTVGTEGGDPQYNANGDENFVADGGGYPGAFIPSDDQPAYHGELLGAFANAAGQVIGSPFVLGDGPTTVTVPAGGVTQLLLGVNDDQYGDNNGALAIEVTEEGESPSLVISGGVAQLAVAGALSAGLVVFAPGAGSSATLEIAAADLPANGGDLTNPLSDFDSAVDALDLRGLAYVSGATAVASGGVLTVTDGSEVLHFKLEGAVYPSFVASSDGDGGLVVREQQALTISAGVTSSGLTVGSGDQLTVLSGGEAESSTVLSCGSATVSAGGVGSALTVSSGGQLDGPGELAGSSFDDGQVSGVSVGAAGGHSAYLEIQSGGAAEAVTVVDGVLQIDSGASATGTVLSSGTQDLVYGVASGTTIDSGGVAYIRSGGEAVGDVLSSGGKEFVTATGSAADSTLISGAEVVLAASNATLGGTLTFSGGGNTLEAQGSGHDDQAVIGGFSAGDTIDLPNLLSNSALSLLVTTVGGDGNTLAEVVSGGGTVEDTFTFAGTTSYTSDSLVLTADADGFVEIAYRSIVTVSSGVTSSGLMISSGGELIVLSGGTAEDSAILSGASVSVAAGGIGDQLTIVGNGLDAGQVSGGSLGISSGNSGGHAPSKLEVLSGGAADAVTIYDGDLQIDSGASASKLVVSGGTFNDSVVLGSVTIESGGSADAVTIDGGVLVISSGASATGTLMNDWDDFVYGVASDTTVASGAYEFVSSGGETVDSVVSSGGNEVIESGGSVSGLTIESGGSAQFLTLTVSSGESIGLGSGVGSGVVTSTTTLAGLVTVSSGGSLIISGGLAVQSGGVLTLSAGAVGSGVVVSSGGQLDGPGELVGSSFDAGQVSGVSVGAAGGPSAFLEVQSGGAAEAVTVVDGVLQIDFGASATGTVLSGSGTQEQIHGVASGTAIGSGGEELVSSGGVASGAEVLSGGLQVISSGAAAVGATVSSGGAEHVLASGTTTGTQVRGGEALISSGGIASGTILFSGGLAYVETGGLAVGTVLSDGGKAIVRAGGGASATMVLSGGVEYLRGGTTTGTAVNSGGKQVVSSGGVASATDVVGGLAYVFAGGRVAGETVESGGKALVSSGGFASATQVSSGGLAYVYADGRASGTVVSEGGKAVVRSGGVVDGTQVLSGGVQYLWAGATVGTVVSGGKQVVSSGGAAHDTVLLSGALGYVSSGAAAYGAVLSNGAVQTTELGGASHRTTVLDGGIDQVGSGGAAFGDVVSNGGSEAIASGGYGLNLAVLSGGFLTLDGEVRIAGAGTLDGTLTGSGAVVETGGGDLVLGGSGATFAGKAAISGGTIELASVGAIGGGYVQFVAPSTGSAVLQIDAADAPLAGGSFANVISNFSGDGEEIDLTGLTFVTGATAGVKGSILTLNDGGNTYSFDLAGAVGASYTVTSDASGGTVIDASTALFIQAAAAFAPVDAATAVLASSISSTAQTPFAHATASAGRA